jgi:hypothetical protein
MTSGGAGVLDLCSADAASTTALFGQLLQAWSTLMTPQPGEKSRRHNMPAHFHGTSSNSGSTMP